MKTTDKSLNLNNMPAAENHRLSVLFKTLIWVSIIFYLFAGFMSFYKKAVYADLLLGYVWIPAATAIAVGLYCKVYLHRRIHLAYLCFLIWLIITYWFKDDLLITDPTNRTFLISRCIICFIFLPFAYIMNDRDKRRHLDAFLGIVVTITAVLLWLSYIGILRGESFSLFGDRFMFGATYTYTDRMMLQFFNLYYYKTGYLALICFFSTLYLSVSHWSRRSSIAYIFLMMTFLIAVIITYSRTAVFTFVIGVVIAVYILLQQLPLKKWIRRIIVICGSLGGIVIAAAGLNFTYKFFNSIRDIWYGIETLSSRTDIWASITDLVHENPQSLLYGLPIRESMPIMNGYIDLADKVSNMHSGYLQTLVLVGIPGLLAIIAFCIYLIIASGKIIFSKKYAAKENIPLKLMVIIPACCLVMNLIESLVFFNPVQTDILNMFLALFSGYIIEYGYHRDPS